MGKGFKHGASGASKGETPLNFEIIAYPSEVDLNVATPAENTIGIVTSNPIKGWYFSATQPENMAEGEVWFSVGATSAVEFNALKDNTIKVYPLSAKQWVSGALTDVKCKTYRGGAWVDWWNGELYKDGNEYTDVTGGWTSTSMGIGSGSDKKGTLDVSRGEKTVTIKITSASGGAVFHTAKKINLSGRSELVFDGTVTTSSTSTSACNFYVWSEFGSYYNQNTVATQNVQAMDGTFSLDVSGLDGEYYVGFGLYNALAEVTMRSLIMK